ncbi:MAG: hypothetical protein AAFR47_19990 [Pseudomonadota bacterium]
MALRPAPICFALALAMGPDGLSGAPSDDTDPARARVAAQCAAFWSAAGAEIRAARFRALAERLAADPGAPARFEANVAADMDRLARGARSDPDSARLFARHAHLCGGR